ncbi:MAG: hypothetical protein HRU36_03490 [Rickettsiales bacterium]|nr:hypothetical protein [Rickettsiales bacterium]
MTKRLVIKKIKALLGNGNSIDEARDILISQGYPSELINNQIKLLIIDGQIQNPKRKQKKEPIIETTATEPPKAEPPVDTKEQESQQIDTPLTETTTEEILETKTTIDRQEESPQQADVPTEEYTTGTTTDETSGTETTIDGQEESPQQTDVPTEEHATGTTTDETSGTETTDSTDSQDGTASYWDSIVGSVVDTVKSNIYGNTENATIPQNTTEANSTDSQEQEPLQTDNQTQQEPAGEAPNNDHSDL